MCLMAHLRMRKSEDNTYSYFCFITIPISKGHQTEQDITLFCLKKIWEILFFSLDKGKHAASTYILFLNDKEFSIPNEIMTLKVSGDHFSATIAKMQIYTPVHDSDLKLFNSIKLLVYITFW